MEKNKFTATFKYKLIYIFRINDESHKGFLKIGEATVHTNKDKYELKPNCEELIQSAHNRISSYTSTAGVVYDLLYTELAVTNSNEIFSDKKVHNVLKRSGIKNHYFNTIKNQNEWFEVNLETAKNAIIAVKEGKKSLNSNQISDKPDPIEFRPEQEKAIKEAIRCFKTHDSMLWNAKMRFGKTLSALEIVKRNKYKKTIIITHRPVVSDSWFQDFNKIFYDNKEYKFGSKTIGESIDNLLKEDKPFVYFASIQDLRESSKVGGRYVKDEKIFNCKWDFVVIDEAHEGTKTELGEKTIEGVVKLNDGHTTKILYLSGTPFNLMSDFSPEQIFTWDYIMEQSEKANWDKTHLGDPNPYEDLPQLNIYTYELTKIFSNYLDVQESSFNFREFFRTWTGKIETDRKPLPEGRNIGDFVHENDVRRFLELLCKPSEESNYPFSKEEYRKYFRHSLWMVPGVKEGKALSKLLQEYDCYNSFKIINVCGNEESKDPLKDVRQAIGENPEETYTITLSCGKLTTGVTVKEWTAVFYLMGSYNTSASSYLQTIFRVQSPAEINGKMKEKCYVFDFAPDRALKMLASAGGLSYRAGSISTNKVMGELLNYCPVISVNGSKMITYDVPHMLRQLKKAVAQRVVDSGFADTKIYNDNLLKLDDIQLKEFNELKRIIGSDGKQPKKISEIVINGQGFSNEQYEQLKKAKEKRTKDLTEEEKRLIEEEKKKKKEAISAISILRAISIRIPLLIYGADIDIKKDIDVNNFTEIIDDLSWKEFMPKGVTKELFKKFSKYYDNDIFIAAGHQIRNNALYADSLPVKERIQRISEIFSTFRNPDKETVLTPWKTVNMHLSTCIGGYNFNNEDNEPIFIDRGQVTKDLFYNKNVKILEINSKTGLYPLYCAFSIYKNKIINYNKSDFNENKEIEYWDETIKNNIYIICKTQMAKQITKRTLVGFRNSEINIIVIEDIVEKLKEDINSCTNKILKPEEWGEKGGDNMKFDAIVGNPPYQEPVANNKGKRSKAKAIYHLFFDEARKLDSDYISVIMPSRWMTKSTEGISDNWVDEVISCNKIPLMHDYLSSNECFQNVDIKGGVCYFLYDNKYNDKCNYYLHELNNTSPTHKKMYLNEDNRGIVIRDKMAYKIIAKIEVVNGNYISNNDLNFSSYIGPKDCFTNKKVLTSSWNGFVNKKDKKHKIKYYCNKNNLKTNYGYIEESIIPKNHQAIEINKVYIPAAAGTGKDKNILGKPFYGEPYSVCSQTYLVIGYNKKLTEEQCKNIIKYIHTKFFRYLVNIKKKTQNGPKGVYQFVPIQNFTNKSDIKWSKKISEIDAQLYKKYQLSEDEISDIEAKIQYLK